MVRPEGNDRYVRNAPKNPKETRWMYDDDVSSLSRETAIQADDIDCIRAWGAWVLINDNNDHINIHIAHSIFV